MIFVKRLGIGIIALLAFLFTLHGALAVDEVNLTAEWRFDEGTGTSASDSTGNGHTLSGVNTPGWTAAGIISNATDLEAGSSEYWNRAAGDLFPSFGTPYTINLWIKPESTGQPSQRFIVSKAGDASINYGRYHIIQYTDDKIRYRAHTAADAEVGPSSTTTVSAGTWYMVTAQYDGGTTMLLWINGVNEANATIVSFKNTGEGPFRVGESSISSSLFWDGVVDEMTFWMNRTLTGAEINELYNGGSAARPTGNTGVPSWVAPTPADGSANNTQVTLNASGTDAETYFVWFDTNPDPVTLVVNNATTGNFTTSVNSSTLTYYYKAQAWNSTLGYSENTTVRNWTFDAVNPAIQLNPTNEFNAQNYSLQNPFDDNVDLNITFTDDHDLYGMSVNITRGGTVYFNVSNESLSGLAYTYENDVNSTSWPVGEYNVSVYVSDSHTAREIPTYQVTKKKSSITFKTETDNNIKIETRETSTIEATKELDRYEFSVSFNDRLTKSRTFDVKTDKCPLTYRQNSGYKAHFVSACGVTGGNWVDFEGVTGTPTVNRIDDYHYTVTFDTLAPDVTFKSIGGLNVLNANYTFYLGNYSTSTPQVFALEVSTLGLNMTTEARIANITSTLTYNGTTYDPTTLNSSTLYRFAQTVQAPNATVNLTPYWTVNVTQGDGNFSLFNITVTQIVQDWEITSCGSPAFINWTQYDEDNPSTMLTGTFAVEITYWVGNESNAKLYNESFPSGTSWSVCFTPVDGTFYAHIYGQNTVPNSFTHRFYVQNQTYTNDTTQYSIYNANSSNAILYSDMKITARSEDNYAYFPNVFAQLQRRYVGEGVWRTVQYDKSGDFGLIFFDVREEFIDYRIRYYDENNTLLLATESLKFVCTSAVCELTQLLNPSTSTAPDPDVTATWEYDNSTKILTVTWSSGNGQESTVDITVTKEALNGVTSICSTTQTGAAGSFECNATGYTGELFVAVDVDGAPNDGGFVPTTRDRLSAYLSGPMSALVTFLLMLTIIGFGLFSPMALVITTVLSLVVVFFLGTAPYVSMTFIILAAAAGFAISMKVKQ